jgi:mRNA interferase HicA
VYTEVVKKKELERRLLLLGWWFLKHGKKHDIWTNGNSIEVLPRHNEVNERLAKAILRNAEKEK